MGTIKPYDVDTMRVKASQCIHTKFRNVPFIYIKYKDTFAEGYCQYKDGLIVTFTVWYRDMLICTSVEEVTSQHEKAMEYINSIPERAWAS